jgi:SNF2-related domain
MAEPPSRRSQQLAVDRGRYRACMTQFRCIIRCESLESPFNCGLPMPIFASAPGDPPKPDKAQYRKSRRRRRAKAVLDRPALPPGWLTSDEDEIALRRWRGRTEILSVKALEPGRSYFGTFRAQSATGGSYEVEIRSFDGLVNSCGCIDYRVNGLGTCKHIEGTIAAMARGRAKSFRAAKSAGNPRVEAFLDRRSTAMPAIMWPAEGTGRSFKLAREWLHDYLAADGTLTRDPQRIETLISEWNAAPEALRRILQVSRHFTPWLDRARRERQRVAARVAFEADLAAGRETLDIVTHPLLPYQREGVLHLAFGERALLADEMGLGKTIQGIAACVLLAKLKHIERVAVVCPASLKAEWEEQIARFCDRSTRLVFGAGVQRRAAYRDPAFFTIVNYEQVLSDAEDINNILKPDVVILDEAHQELANQDCPPRQVPAISLRLRAHRNASREPHR